jgi:hypothetical protein
MNYLNLKQEIESTKKKLRELKKKIYKSSDGYIYACRVSAYGYTKITIYYNEYMAQELAYEYNGDNGYCNITTTNPNNSLECTEGHEAEIISEEMFDEVYPHLRKK